MNKSYPKYLSRNIVTHKIEPKPEHKFSQLVVIPALDELEYIQDTLNSLNNNSSESLTSTAVVVVVNNSTTTSNDKVQNNQKLLKLFREGMADNFKNLNLFWIDASSPGNEIQGDGGVGTARKIGMDGMLSYLDDDSLIFSLDADTLVSDNYIVATREWFDNNKSYSAAVIHFEHRFDNEYAVDAIVDYELFMRQFIVGLRNIGSWYNYYSIGSAIVIRSTAYIKAGGMRVRNGGEDFYFMQATRKIGLIGEINNSVVYPSARFSNRVNFGTGPKMQEVVKGCEILGYNPNVFEAIRSIFNVVNNLESETFEQLTEIMSTELEPVVWSFFESSNFGNVWRKVYKNTPKVKEKIVVAFHIWFDALRTLRFVHHIEENAPDKFKRIPVSEAFRHMSKLYNINIPENAFDSHKKLLIWLRKHRM